jgi:predicted transposase
MPYTTDDTSLKEIHSLMKQFSSVVRYSYNRYFEGVTDIKKIKSLVSNLNNIQDLKAKLIEYAILEGKDVHTTSKDKKVIFGGKNNFYERCKGKISNDEFKLNKLSPITCQGTTNNKGNSYFELDIIDNNQIIFKVNKNLHIPLYLPSLRKNIQKELFKLQQLNNVKPNIEKGYKFSVKLDLKYIYISFEEFKSEEKNLPLKERYLGIDMNPNNIGISISENDKIIHTQEFILKELTDKFISLKLKSSSDKAKYFQNKIKHEVIEISKKISLLAQYYNCKAVFIEDLSFKQKDAGKGKNYNRKNNNLWKRNLFIENLSKRLFIEDIKLYRINPAYSSIIGNLQHSYSDAVNASIEIVRRGIECIIKRNKGNFYPNLLIKEQWKQTFVKCTNWKEISLKIKNSGLKYRVSIEECSHSYKVFQLNSRKSKVKTFVFERI